MIVTTKPPKAEGFRPRRIASEESGSPLSANAKLLTILFLLANHMACVSATPLGSPTMSESSFYWVLLVVVLAIIAAIWKLSTTKSPIKVLGLTYDKDSHKLELTVQNTGGEPYEVKSAMRLVQPAEQIIQAATTEGNIPMASAKASVGDRKLFSLLCEDDSPILIPPNESRTVSYSVMLPPEMLELDASKNVEVHISYGESDLPQMVPQMEEPIIEEDDDSISLELREGDIIQSQYLIEDLLEALKNSSEEAIVGHIGDVNEVSTWVRYVVGDDNLADKLDSIEYEDPAVAKASMIDAVDTHLEGLKHPYLRKVAGGNEFIIKETDADIIAHVSILDELADIMAIASKQTMDFHLKEGNDFSSWIKGVIGDAELAEKINSIDYSDTESGRDKAVSAIRERVDELSH